MTFQASNSKSRIFKVIASAFFIFTLVISDATHAKGNPEAGKSKSATCVTCHGPDGNSIIQLYPKIAGQHDNYLLKTLLAYQALSTNPQSDKATHKSANAGIMNAQVAQLSQQDLEDLVAYYSSQKMSMGETSAQSYDLGRKLYLGGDLERGIPACAACHSPTGTGNYPAMFPRLAGQQSEYIKAQLLAFKSDERLNDMMQVLAKKLNDEDIAAVSSFASGLTAK
ncbi:MAG: cytochrome c4 [Gammaproteobacteria bacterium]|nr:cytochrome c4 [Gammaproteobacteria bacterium]